MTNINELGEFGLIDKITQQFKNKNQDTILGIGDDAAIIAKNEEEVYVVSSDLLAEGIHFDLTYVPLKHLGYKSVVVNLSDIAAMNALPSQITVSIAVSSRFTVEAIEELYAGIKQACEAYNVDLVGGDTTSSKSGLVISITAIGSCKKEQISKRSTAKPNEAICVTGDLGGAYIGLHLLEREKVGFRENPEAQPDFNGKEYLLERQLKPEARTDIIHEFRERNIVPSSMIDISDGLASELLHISKSSGLSMKIFDDQLPIAEMTKMEAIEFNINGTTCAMNGGEDYELLFTLPQVEYEKLKDVSDITAIGITSADENQNMLVSKQGTAIPITAQGWNHFNAEEN